MSCITSGKASRIGRLASRVLLVLGGAAAATAVSWAVSSGAASAYASDGGRTDLGLDAIDQAGTTVEGLAGTVNTDLGQPDALSAVGTTIDDLTTRSVRLPMSAAAASCDDPLTCAQGLVEDDTLRDLTGGDAEGSNDISGDPAGLVPLGPPTQFDPQSWNRVNGVTDVLRNVPPRSEVDARQRTTSGKTVAPSGTGDAPTHAPEPVPITMPAAPAGGSGSGSSLSLLATPAGVDGLFPHIVVSRTELPDHSGRPYAPNAQPGVAPD